MLKYTQACRDYLYIMETPCLSNNLCMWWYKVMSNDFIIHLYNLQRLSICSLKANYFTGTYRPSPSSLMITY